LGTPLLPGAPSLPGTPPWRETLLSPTASMPQRGQKTRMIQVGRVERMAQRRPDWRPRGKARHERWGPVRVVGPSSAASASRGVPAVSACPCFAFRRTADRRIPRTGVRPAATRGTSRVNVINSPIVHLADKPDNPVSAGLAAPAGPRCALLRDHGEKTLVRSSSTTIMKRSGMGCAVASA
jgi:hypothetical protein